MGTERKVRIDLDGLKTLAQAARHAGTQDRFIDLALDWASQMDAEIERLEKEVAFWSGAAGELALKVAGRE